jgi:hypothetical protein
MLLIFVVALLMKRPSRMPRLKYPRQRCCIPLPSTVSVSGISGTVSKLTVNIKGLAHSAKDDLDIMLLGGVRRRLVQLQRAVICNKCLVKVVTT